MRDSAHDFWVHSGTTGAEWLINRLATETHIDVLDGVANLLADLGATSIGPILTKLNARPTRDQADVLLRALGWAEAPRHAIAIPPVAVEKLLQPISTIRTLIFGVPPAPPPASCPMTEQSPCSTEDEASNLTPKFSNLSTKPSSDESQTNPPRTFLWRRIGKSRWEGKNPLFAGDVDAAALNFALRKGEEYLSFFEVASEDEGRRVAAAFSVIGEGRPDKIDFMLFASRITS